MSEPKRKKELPDATVAKEGMEAKVGCMSRNIDLSRTFGVCVCSFMCNQRVSCNYHMCVYQVIEQAHMGSNPRTQYCTEYHAVRVDGHCNTVVSLLFGNLQYVLSS